MPEPAAAEPAARDRSAKRPRTSTACVPCRQRRAKCDGTKPQCGRCTRRQLDCLYNFDNDKRKPVTKDVVQALQMKIESLEKELADVKSRDAGGMGPSTSGYAGQHARQAVTDSFAGGLAVNSHGELRFYGPTSSYRAILGEATESAVEAARAWSLTRAPIPYAPPLDPHLPKKPPVLSAQLSGKLIELAFEYCFSQFGMVDERAFLSDLGRSATQRTPNYSPLLLHIVLAIGSRYLSPDDPDVPTLCSDPNDPSTRGDCFINWARLMIDQEWYHPDVSTVRALICLSTYLAGQALDGPALMFGAQAMRLTEDFGLHLDVDRLQIGSGSISDSLRASRRNAFYAAFSMDISMSIHLGRRPLLSVSDVDISIPTVDNEIEFDAPAHRSSSFVASCKLTNIASRLLETVYSLKAGTSLTARQAAVPELHLALETWYHELPSPLRASTPTPSKAPHPHILGLNALYHATVIQLHRPFFRRTSDGSEVGVSTEKCLSSSKHIVRLVRLQRETRGLRMVHPLFQYCCFTSGTILALSAIEDNIIGEPVTDAERKKQAAIDLKIIIDALREIAVTWKTALTSAAVLETFNQAWNAKNGAPSSAAPAPPGITLPIAQDAPLLLPNTTFSLPLSSEIAPDTPVTAPFDLNELDEFTAGLSAGSFPHIFPSWDLASGNVTSALDDFMGLLNPDAGHGEFAPMSFSENPLVHFDEASSSASLS
ncbi:hypothetical protein JCM10207_008106 [Rhodosporidiobolus poonsookiae]